MTAVPHYTIHCDTEGCTSSHTPPVESGRSVSRARQHAARHGWVYLTLRKSRRDLCPEHARAGR